MAGLRFFATRRSLLGGVAPVIAGLAGRRQADARTATLPAAQVALFVSFDVLAEDIEALRRLLQLLADRAAMPAGSGVLVTTALGGSLFDRRYGLQALRPRHLGDGRPAPRDGDLLLVIAADAQADAVGVLRDIAGFAHAQLAPRWKLNGFAPRSAGSVPAWPDLPRIGPEHGDEPAWIQGGHYLEVRQVRRFVERRGQPAPASGRSTRIYDYDHGIDQAGQFDMGEIHCLHAARPEDLAAPGPGRRGCGGRFAVATSPWLGSG